MIKLKFYVYELETVLSNEKTNDLQYVGYHDKLIKSIQLEDLDDAKPLIKIFLDNNHGYVHLEPYQITIDNKQDFFDTMLNRGLYAIKYEVSKIKVKVRGESYE